MKPEVSIIVPIFNAEDYIPRCINSLLRQTLENVEILLVIDAQSNQESRDIVFDYCDKDDRIRVIHEDAVGASAVRNIGLRYAKGEYIGFVDADDYILPNMYSDLSSFASKHNLDIAVSGILRDNGDSQPVRLSLLYPEEITCTEEISRRDLLYKWALSAQANPVWNKIYRTDFLNINQLQFHESIRIGEDGVFNALCLNKAISVGSIAKANYVYFNRKSSQMYTVHIADTLKDFKSRWKVFMQIAENMMDGRAFLAIASLRIIANGVAIFKMRNRSLTEACDFAETLIFSLQLQPHLDYSMKPGVLSAFANQSNMDDLERDHFGRFAEAAYNGKEKLLEWQLYFTNVIEKKG